MGYAFNARWGQRAGTRFAGASSPQSSASRLPSRVRPGTHAAVTSTMSDITINELEAAINFWRARSPSSGDELSLCKEASALSKPYALLIVQRRGHMPVEALEAPARAAWEGYRQAMDGEAGRSDG